MSSPESGAAMGLWAMGVDGFDTDESGRETDKPMLMTRSEK